MARILLAFAFIILIHSHSDAQTEQIALHFIHGSKPRHAYRKVEPKWFGGLLGGHVGISFRPNSVLSFGPSGKFHWIAHPKTPHSHFVRHDTVAFWEVLGSPKDSIRKTSIYIPVESWQIEALDSLERAYMSQTPYDYAFLGMRCASSTYEILSQIGIVRRKSNTGAVLRIFYPRKLRKLILRKARQQGWKVVHSEGTARRFWE